MPTVTKRDIVQRIVAETGQAGATVKKVVRLVLDEIHISLAAGDRVEFRNFGVFEVVKRKPRTGRNPRTGETVQVPSKRVVMFKPGKVMKESAQSGKSRL